MCRKTRGKVGITNTGAASSVERQENSIKELTGTIRKGTHSVLWDGSLNKSIEFARRGNELGVEAKVVLCLAMFRTRIPILGFKMPIIGSHFYVEASGKQYEVSYLFENEKPSVPKVLTQLGRFSVRGTKHDYGK